MQAVYQFGWFKQKADNKNRFFALDLGDEVCYTKNTAEEDLRDKIYNAMKLVRWEVVAYGKLFFH